MKRMYEKPVAEVIKMYDNMQMICVSTGFQTKTARNIIVDNWDNTEIDAEGTSDDNISDDESTWPDWPPTPHK